MKKRMKNKFSFKKFKKKIKEKSSISIEKVKAYLRRFFIKFVKTSSINASVKLKQALTKYIYHFPIFTLNK